MIQYPKITIITPSYNQGAYIEDTILSIINQNYPNLQYIIIDGGSTDNTIDVIKKHESKIDYWISEKDTGQSNAINKGLKFATGELINWINSDDQLAENALFDIASVFRSNPGCGLFIGQTEFYSAETNFGKGGQIVFPTREMTFAFGQVNQPAMFYKIDAVKKMGALNELLHYCMDTDWWLKYLLHFDLKTIALTDSVWAKFRYHDNSKTLTYPLEFKNDKHGIYENIFMFYDVIKTSDKTKLREKNYPATTTLDLQKALNYYYLWRSDELSIEKKKKESMEFWRKVNPFKLINSEKKRYFAVLKNVLFN